MALINDHKLIDDEKNGLRPPDGVGTDYWNIVGIRDGFLFVTCSWWQRQTGVVQWAEPGQKNPDCRTVYQWAFEIASALETYIKRTK